MNVSSIDWSRYFGGQMDIDDTRHCVNRLGQIKSVRVCDDVLHAVFEWTARGDVYPLAAAWLDDDHEEFRLNLDDCEIAPNGAVIKIDSAGGLSVKIYPKGHAAVVGREEVRLAAA